MVRFTRSTLFALAVLSGCAPAPSIRGNTWDGDVGSGTGSVTIELTNDLTSEAKVYLVQSSERRMLGTVLAQRTRRFSLPANVICGRDASLAVAPIGGSSAYTTEGFVSWPGQVLVFHVKDNGAVRFADRQ